MNATRVDPVSQASEPVSQTSLPTARSRSVLALTVPVLVAVIAIASAITGAILFDTEGWRWARFGTWLVRELVPGTIVFAIAGLIVLRSPRAKWVGWVMLASSAAWGLSVLCAGLYIQPYLYAFSMYRPMGELSYVFNGIGGYLLFFLLPQVFPDGPLRGRLWRGLLVGQAVLATATRGYIVWLGWPGGLHRPSIFDAIVIRDRLDAVYFYSGVLLALGTLAARLLRGSRLVRQQVTPFAVVWLITVAADELRYQLVGQPQQSWPYAAYFLWPVVVAVVIGVTVTRVGLWNARLVVRRFVVYAAMVGLLTAVFAAVYVVTLLVLSSGTAQARHPWLAPLIAAVAVLAVDPLRRRVKDRLELRLLGERSEPLRPLAKLDALSSIEQTSVDDLHRTITQTVAAAVRSPGVSLALHRAARDRAPTITVVATSGAPPEAPFVLPLLHRAERLGELRIAPRTPGEPYGRRDRQLLDRLASQAAALVYGFRRDADIDRLRSEAIEALTRQRSELGRDLHDSLAPLLAGAGLTAEALRRGMAEGSAEAAEASRLAGRLRAAASQVRLISHDMQAQPEQPSFASTMLDLIASQRGPGAPRITLDIADGADSMLPAATELALAAVATEAISNVVEHAQAAYADVALARDGTVTVLTVVDDGRGIVLPYVAGTGIASMRGRVEALGGNLLIAPNRPTGTVLAVRLP